MARSRRTQPKVTDPSTWTPTQKRAIKAHLMETNRQARYGMLATNTMLGELQAIDQTGPEQMDEYADHMDRFWLNAQAMLNAAALLSKMLWPSERGDQWRGRALRQALGVQPDSPLKNRKMRNLFEHFDEQLDRWARTPEPVIYVNGGISSRAGIDQFIRSTMGLSGPVPPTKLLRIYDPETHRLLFFEHEQEVQPLWFALVDLEARTRGPILDVESFFSGT
jgi:hypothetical protein